MNRQYIGARYVPKFSDKNDGVWDNAYSYEPLEIVKHGNDFYTSKKPVPVGTQINDTNYWVLTGDYNGAIAYLSERVSMLERIKTVDTRNDISTTICNAGDIINTKNCYAGDGIDSTWIAESGMGNGYTSITLTNGLKASLVHGNTIHAHMIGAFPNDADCEGAINYALENIDNVNILFGKGTYTFTENIEMKNYTSIIGEGDNTILYCSQDPTDQHGEFIRIFREDGKTIGCKVENVSIKIYTATSPNEDVNPFGIGNCEDVIIDGVHILNSNWRGIQVETTSYPVKDLTIRNCIIENTALNCMGISHTAGGSIKNVLVENCKFYNPKSGFGCVYLEGDNMDNVVFNNIYAETTDDIARAFYMVGAKNVTISNLTVKTTATAIAYVLLMQNSSNVILSNIRLLAVTSGELIGVGMLNTKNVMLTNYHCDNIDLGIRSVVISAGDSDNLLFSNILQTNGRKCCVIDTTTTKGYLTGAISNGTVLSSSSTNFKEITA